MNVISSFPHRVLCIHLVLMSLDQENKRHSKAKALRISHKQDLMKTK